MSASQQAARRQAARARGDCGVCCKRPAVPARFRCAECAKLRSSEARRVREPTFHMSRKSRYWALRAAGICTRCGDPSPECHACPGCLRAFSIKRALLKEARSGEGVAA